MGRLIRIVAPHFVAGITESDAPAIVKYMVALTTEEIIKYCHQKKWQVEVLMNEKMKMKGTVKWCDSTDKWGKKLWSFTLREEDGFFGCGISDPKVRKGDSIEFDYEVVNGRAAVIIDSIQLLSGAPSARSSDSYGPNYQSNKTNGSGGGNAQYWENKATRDLENDEYRRANDLRIQWQSARNAAIEVAGILVTAGLIQIPEKKGAGYDVVMGKIEDLTREFFEATNKVGAQQEENNNNA